MEPRARPVPSRPVTGGATRVAIPVPGNPMPAAGGNFNKTASYNKTSTSLGRTGGYYPPQDSSGLGIRKIAALLFAFVGLSYGAPKMGWFNMPIVSSITGWKIAVAKTDDPSPKSPDDGVFPSDSDPGNREPAGVSPPAKLRLNIFPEGSDTRVSVNGLVVLDPGKPIDVPTNTLVTLSIQRPGFNPFRSEFKIDSRSLGTSGEYVKEISLDPDNKGELDMTIKGDKGYLTVRSTPGADTKIFLNGHLWGRKYAPFEMLPVPLGKLELQLYNSTLDLEDKIQVEVEKNRTKQVQSNLKPKKR